MRFPRSVNNRPELRFLKLMYGYYVGPIFGLELHDFFGLDVRTADKMSNKFNNCSNITRGYVRRYLFQLIIYF